MNCTPCGFTILDHPHKLIEDGVCNPNCVYVDGSSEPKDLSKISCAECAALKWPAGNEQISTEVWGNLQARCAAKCIIPGSAQSQTATQQQEQTQQSNKKIWAVALVLIIAIIVAALIYII